MNEELVSFLEKYDTENWLQSMPKYQQNMIAAMYTNLGDYEKVAQEWLCVTNKNTAPFGSSSPRMPQLEKILDELEAFFRGDPKYQSEIRSLMADQNIVQYGIVSAISQAIASTVGTASVFISPIIGIFLFTAVKMGINAWLKAREEKRNHKT